jgi:hypothetical protein
MNESSHTLKRPNLYWINLKVILCRPLTILMAVAIVFMTVPLILVPNRNIILLPQIMFASYLAGAAIAQAQLAILMRPVSFCLPGHRTPAVRIICWSGVLVSGLMALTLFCTAEKPEEISHLVHMARSLGIWGIGLSLYFVAINNFLTIAIVDGITKKIRMAIGFCFAVIIFVTIFSPSFFSLIAIWMIPVSIIYFAFSWRRIHNPETFRRLAGSELQSFSRSDLIKFNEISSKSNLFGTFNPFGSAATSVMEIFRPQGSLRLSIGYFYTFLSRAPLLYYPLFVIVFLLFVGFLPVRKSFLSYAAIASCFFMLGQKDFPLFHPGLLVSGRKQQFQAGLIFALAFTAILSAYMFAMFGLLDALRPVIQAVAEYFQFEPASWFSTPGSSNWVWVPILMPLGLMIGLMHKSYRPHVATVWMVSMCLSSGPYFSGPDFIDRYWLPLLAMAVAGWLIWILLLYRRTFRLDGTDRMIKSEVNSVVVSLILVISIFFITNSLVPGPVKFEQTVACANAYYEEYKADPNDSRLAMNSLTVYTKLAQTIADKTSFEEAMARVYEQEGYLYEIEKNREGFIARVKKFGINSFEEKEAFLNNATDVADSILDSTPLNKTQRAAALLCRGQIRLCNNDLEGAKNDLQKSKELGGANPLSSRLEGWILLREGQFATAEMKFKDVQDELKSWKPDPTDWSTQLLYLLENGPVEPGLTLEEKISRFRLKKYISFMGSNIEFYARGAEALKGFKDEASNKPTKRAKDPINK